MIPRLAADWILPFIRTDSNRDFDSIMIPPVAQSATMAQYTVSDLPGIEKSARTYRMVVMGECMTGIFEHFQRKLQKWGSVLTSERIDLKTGKSTPRSIMKLDSE